jgi:energy-coupling factor transporter ATP-binding protein EcfA2
VLLFKLGYVERADLGITASSGPMQSVLAQALAASTKPSFFRSLFLPAKVPAPAPRSVLQVCVLGDNGVGKSSFVWSLTGLRAPGLGGDVEMGVEYSKFSEAIVVGGCALRLGSGVTASLTGGAARLGKGRSGGDAVAAQAHAALLSEVLTESCELSIAAVPLDQAESWLEHCIHSCDLAVLMFQSANATSLKTAIALDARLPHTVPRLFVASKADTIPSAQVLSLGAHSPTQRGEFGNQTRSSREALKAAHESVLQEASLHIQARGLPPLALLSTLTGDGVTEAYNTIVDVATDPTRGIPRKPTKDKSGFGISAPVVVVTTVVVGVASLALLARYNKGVRDWLDSVFLSTRTFLLGAP